MQLDAEYFCWQTAGGTPSTSGSQIDHTVELHASVEASASTAAKGDRLLQTDSCIV